MAPGSSSSYGFRTLERQRKAVNPGKEFEYPDAQNITAPHVESFDTIWEAAGPKTPALIDVATELLGKQAMYDRRGAGLGTKITFWVDRLRLDKPSLTSRETQSANRLTYPTECRQRSITYRGRLVGSLHYQVGDNPEQVEEKSFGTLPVMVRSNRCNLQGMGPAELVRNHEEPEEMGGYFIINGNEKVVRLLIAQRRNHILAIQRPSYGNRGPGFTPFATQIRCVRRDQTSQTITMHYLTTGNLLLRFALRKQEYLVPVSLLMRALVGASDREIFEAVVGGDAENIFVRDRVELLLRSSKDYMVYTREQALAYLGDKFRVVMYAPEDMSNAEIGQQLLDRMVMVHLTDARDKFNMLAHMVRKLYAVVSGECQEDNPDAQQMQEAYLPGHLYLALIKEKVEDYLLGVRGELTKDAGTGKVDLFSRKYLSRVFARVPADIGQKAQYFLATGNLISRTGLDMQQTSGYTIIAEKLNYLRYLSHFRCIHRGAFFAELKTTAVRKLLPEGWGFLCVTADTEVVLDNGMDVARICDLADGSRVATIDPTSLAVTGSAIDHWFRKMPERLLRVTLADGRVIKATPEHPLRAAPVDIRTGQAGAPAWVDVGDLDATKHALLVSPQPAYIAPPADYKLCPELEQLESVPSAAASAARLQQLGLVGSELPLPKVLAAARLLGAVHTAGRLDQLHVGDDADVAAVNSDLATLGFASATVSKESASRLSLEADAIAFLEVLGASRHSKDRVLPQWLGDAPVLVKREFLAALFGSDGSCISISQNQQGWAPAMDALGFDYTEEQLPATDAYANQVVALLGDVGVSASTSRRVDEGKASVLIQIELTGANLVAFYERVGYRYSASKAQNSAVPVQYLKTCEFSAQQRKERSARDEAVAVDDAPEWAEFQKLRSAESPAFVWSPIVSIEDIEPEAVFDFNTASENHSFFANSVVSHNCPVHTPDGAPCGLLNHLAHKCRLTTVVEETDDVERVLMRLGVEPGMPRPSQRDAGLLTVQLDGRIVGYCSQSVAGRVAESLRTLKLQAQKQREENQARRDGKKQKLAADVPYNMEIGFVPASHGGQLPGLFLFTTPARFVRPVTHLATKQQDHVGSFEQVYMEIACMDGDVRPGLSTHMEVVPTNIFSDVANFTPFCDFNQSPRNVYQCQMGKQTMGTPMQSYPYRTDNKLYRLQTGQTPICRPRLYDNYGVDNYPNGCNAVVCVISYTGYDMEDAMILNKSAHDRGFGYGSIYKTEYVDLGKFRKRGDPITTHFGVGRDALSNETLYDRIDMDGLPFPGVQVSDGDPLYAVIDDVRGRTKVMKYKGEFGYVETVRLLASPGEEELQVIAITFRIPRSPIIGDKFSSRHGQKGVCSQKFPAVDMPFTESGMQPDVIINPHAFPSRMTIGMFVESIAAKAGSLHGVCQDATPFQFDETNTAADYFGEQLRQAGYNYHGNEPMYSGVTGQEMRADIYIGVVYYQRLRHMVSDKYQVRTTGPINPLTQQPIKGRKRGGGIRLGEMERDALIAHGAAYFLQDRLMNCSDYSLAYVCRCCGSVLAPVAIPASSHVVDLSRPGGAGTKGMAFAGLSASEARAVMAVANTTRSMGKGPLDLVCKLCQNADGITMVALPYVFRYLATELMSMNMKIRLDVK